MILPLLLLGAMPGYALIITNNKSLDASRPELRYADDDGIAYAGLFDERYGQENVTLLTELDVDSRRLYPTWAARSRAPTRGEVLASVSAIAAKASSDSDVYLVFAGHGDTDRGRGFIELLDARFYAEDLEAIVSQLQAKARVHLVLDSCNSYFMLNPRKPGGARFSSEPQARVSFLERLKNTGAIISTSAEAETYEWSEIQSGIFSYVLRAGLRGAADANGDGRLTYKELDAFVEVATHPIVNEHYRPRTFAQGLNRDLSTEFFVLPTDPQQTRIIKRAGRAERITVRDNQGVRVIDMNADASTAFELLLPRDTERFDVVSHGRTRVSATLKRGQTLVLDQAGFGSSNVASRGDAQVFSALFSDAFGAASVEAHVREPESEAAFGISETKAERFALMLKTFSDEGLSQRKQTAFGLLSGAALGGTAGVTMAVAGGVSLGRGQQDLGLALLGGGGGLAGIGLGLMIPGLVLLTQGQSADERLYSEHMRLDRSTPEARARAVAITERLLFDRVLKLREARKFLSYWTIGGGAALMATGLVYLVVSLVRPPSRSNDTFIIIPATVSGLCIGAGANGIISGLVMRSSVGKSPTERMWDLYEASENGDAPATQPASLEWSVSPFVAPGDHGGVNAGIGGSLKF